MKRFIYFVFIIVMTAGLYSCNKKKNDVPPIADPPLAEGILPTSVAVITPEVTAEVTKEPAVTGMPEVTKETAVTGMPEATKEPAVTGIPEVTKETAVTGMPEATKEPVVTGIPEVTREPAAAPEAGAAVTKPKDPAEMTTAEVIKNMGIGINLGNVYESCGDWIALWGDGTPESYETAWGSPVITKEIIKGYAAEGFKVMRIPVAWSNLMEESYTISEKYLASVQETVDWVLDCDMYAIINLHWDNGWMEAFPTDTEECMKKYIRIWEQVSAAFAAYDHRLLFESQNEELGWNSVWNPWEGSNGKEESYALVNKINQTFVDTVRSSGGNNTTRHLLIAGYNTDIEHTCDPLFEMPDDAAQRCAVSVHYYLPSEFAILTEDADWGKSRSTWGTDEDITYLAKMLDRLKETFADRGIPVIIGEYGCPTVNKETESVRRYISTVCKEAYSRGMCPILWSTQGEHFDRYSCRMVDGVLAEMLRSVVVND